MASEMVITDPTYTPHTGEHSPLNRLLLKLIKEERDLPIIRHLLFMAVVLWPTAVFFYSREDINLYWGIPYWALVYGVFVDRFILALHNFSHRQLYKPEFRWMDKVAIWFIGPFAGETPETYYVHHMGMHHAEGNLEDDLSTTMPFKRDSLLHFIQYWGTFFFFIYPLLGNYLIKRKRTALLKRLIVGEGSWFIAMIALWQVNYVATLILFLIPTALTRFLMMAGNWAQHAFVDPAEPDNDYKSSITCINTRYNRRCFNDGYHIGHHEKPNRHWSEMPTDFASKKAKYAAEDAVIFEGIDYFQVWLLLMLKSYKTLAKHFVDLREEKRSLEEVETLLRSRTLPIRG